MPARINVESRHVALAHRQLRIRKGLDDALADRALSLCINAVAESIAKREQNRTAPTAPDLQQIRAGDQNPFFDE